MDSIPSSDNWRISLLSVSLVTISITCLCLFGSLLIPCYYEELGTDARYLEQVSAKVDPPISLMVTPQLAPSILSIGKSLIGDHVAAVSW